MLGLVETAAAAGIEIPVFCYEPRLGPPVGACRMCLVEVEGIPKLQAGCTLTAQEGMVVRTAATSEKAAEGQNATLEFILVNHPLDCPVCDKGGECPLQDLTFRYGPGTTRMTFPKRTFDKPIPISPLIALDRERCILCYRCTRFSSDVAEDDQLVARNRGAISMITTFEEEPYRAPFSGNVIELCPVGRADIHAVPVRGAPLGHPGGADGLRALPGRLQHAVTTREGKAKRVRSRNHPEVDGGWLCDKGRFAGPHLYADDRITEPLRRDAGEGLAPIGWDEALDTAERLLRGPSGRIVTALSGSERASSRSRSDGCCAKGSARTRRCCPSPCRPRSTRFACRCPRSRTPSSSWSSATSPSSSARRSSISGYAGTPQRRRDRHRSAPTGTCRAEPGSGRRGAPRASPTARAPSPASGRPSGRS